MITKISFEGSNVVTDASLYQWANSNHLIYTGRLISGRSYIPILNVPASACRDSWGEQISVILYVLHCSSSIYLAKSYKIVPPYKFCSRRYCDSLKLFLWLWNIKIGLLKLKDGVPLSLEKNSLSKQLKKNLKKSFKSTSVRSFLVLAWLFFRFSTCIGSSQRVLGDHRKMERLNVAFIERHQKTGSKKNLENDWRIIGQPCPFNTSFYFQHLPISYLDCMLQ